MPRKLIDIDEDTLVRAREIVRADPRHATLDEALAEVVRLAERRTHGLRLADMDGPELEDEPSLTAEGVWDSNPR